MAARTPAKGHTAKHTTSKHRATAKHHPSKTRKPAAGAPAPKVHTVAHHAKPAKPRGCAAGDLLPVCVFEALAQSLRLAGQRVSDDDLMELWWLCGSREASIAEALDAGARFGLAGVRPVQQRHVGPVDAEALRGKVRVARGELGIDLREGLVDALPHLSGEFFGHALILGIDTPGPHAVLATPDGWWSWGSLWSPWPARVEEAWAVSWS